VVIKVATEAYLGLAVPHPERYLHSLVDDKTTSAKRNYTLEPWERTFPRASSLSLSRQERDMGSRNHSTHRLGATVDA